MADNHSTRLVQPSTKTMDNIINLRLDINNGRKSRTINVLDNCFDRSIGLCQVLASSVRYASKNGMDHELFANVIYMLEDEIRQIRYLVDDFPKTTNVNPVNA